MTAIGKPSRKKSTFPGSFSDTRFRKSSVIFVEAPTLQGAEKKSFINSICRATFEGK